METTTTNNTRPPRRSEQCADPTYEPPGLPDGMTRLADYPGYWIDKTGNVWSGLHRKYLRSAPSPNAKQRRYPCVILRVNGKSLNRAVHRLMAETFLPNPNNYPLVRHLDDDPFNNTIGNLAWGTYEMNVADALRNSGTWGRPCAADEAGRREMLARYEGGEHVSTLADELGVTTQTVYRHLKRARAERLAAQDLNNVRYDC